MTLPKEAEAERKDLEVLASDLEDDLTELREFEIETQDDMEFITDELRQYKAQGKALKEKELSLTRPLLGVVNDIRDMFRPPLKFCAEAEGIIKKKIAKKQREAEEEQHRALEEAGKASKKGDTESAKAALRKAKAIDIAPVKGISVREIWDYEVEDFDELLDAVIAGKVSRNVLCVDDDVMAQIVKTKEGKTDIPGIKVFTRDSVTARAK